MTSARGRSTKVLRTLAEEKLKGCEICWETNAVWDLEELLRPLSLRQNERTRLMRVLTCPRCESPLRDYYFDRVVGYETNEIRDLRRIARYEKKYRPDFDAFHRFLLKHPTLGGFHPFGQRLARVIQKAKKRTLSPTMWFHARVSKDGRPFTGDDLGPANPKLHSLPPGRFNCAGQLGYYLAQSGELATVEVLGEDKIGRPTWVSKVQIRCPIKVLNLTINAMGDVEDMPLVLNGLIYTGVVSAYGDDESKPQYRVPQFLADLARERMFDGIRYTRRRDFGPEGTNLVLLRPEHLDMHIEEPVLYSWRERTVDILDGYRLKLQPVGPHPD